MKRGLVWVAIICVFIIALCVFPALAASVDEHTIKVKVEGGKRGQAMNTREVTVAEVNKGKWVAEIQGWNVIPGREHG
jgi:hypothetical protein